MAQGILLKVMVIIPLLSCIYSTCFSHSHSHYGICDEEIRLHTYDKIPQNLKNGKYSREVLCFANETAVYSAKKLRDEALKSSWPEVEDYVNRVMRNVVPEEFLVDSMVHMYVIADGNFNASMTPSGISFVNIGVFAEIYDEATLAGILAHEFAHYHRQHGLKRFIESEKGAFRPFLIGFNKAWTNHSVAAELEADSLAMVWMVQSGYHLNGMVETFKIMKRLQDHYLMQLEDKWELKEVTHPTPENRLKAIYRFIKSHPDYQGEWFLESEEEFNSIQQTLKPEILSFLISSFQYDKAIQTGFNFHLLEPDNSVYVHQLLEAIRRRCYLDNGLWKKNFITHPYYKVHVSNGIKRKIPLDTHLFEKFDPQLLCSRPSKASEIKARFYWTDEQPRFTTNEEAFEFFYILGKKLDEPEVELSYALSYYSDVDKRNKHLAKYLVYPEIQFRQFAESLRGDSIYSSLPDRKLTIYDLFMVTIEDGKDEVSLYEGAEDNLKCIRRIAQRIESEFTSEDFMILHDSRHLDDETKRSLKELSFLGTIYIRSKGERTRLHALDPKYWMVMKELDVNQIDFIDIVFHESLAKSKGTNDLMAHISSNYDSTFVRSKTSRYLYGRVKTIREKPNLGFKSTNYMLRHTLKFKSNSHTQIPGEITIGLRRVASELKLKDAYYR